ncbi:MAG: sulfatase [Pseudomonadota bacterium]
MPTQPNIVLILIDDLGWTDLTCYGSGFYETPNLDRLASEGLLFTDAYASCPVCSPTRASIMTGKYPARVGITQYIPGHAVGRLQDVPYFHGLPKSEVALPIPLSDAGYQTWHVGKWHLGDRQTWPEHMGFDVNVGGCGWGAPRFGFFAPYKMPNLEEGPDGEYLTDRLTTEALSLLENREKDRPFFLNLCHYAVHIPIQSPADLIEKYAEKAQTMGLDREDVIVEGELFGAAHLRGQRVLRRTIQSDPAYAAMIENLDTNIGRVLDCLDHEGLSEDTVVIFTSDNGGLATSNRFEGVPTSNRPLNEGKGWMYEGGTRVCQIVRWPGTVAAGSTTAVPTTSTDLYPTLLELAGAPANPTQHPDGKSLMPVLKNESFERGPIFWHYPHYANQGGRPAAAVRDGPWKLIHHFEDDRYELFDLENDVSETHNLAQTQPAVLDRLREALRQWQTEVEALMPRPNPNWQPDPLGEDVDPAEV